MTLKRHRLGQKRTSIILFVTRVPSRLFRLSLLLLISLSEPSLPPKKKNPQLTFFCVCVCVSSTSDSAAATDSLHRDGPAARAKKVANECALRATRKPDIHG